MRPGRFGWVSWAAVLLAWAPVIVDRGSAWAGDPLFTAMRVSHVAGEVLAPGFVLSTPEKKTVALEDLRGNVIFLNFWATWCPPCRVEMPSMERLHREFKDRGLVVLAVNFEESPKQVARFMKDFQLSFPTVLDVDATVSLRYKVRGLPMTLFIDRTGRMVGAATGARDWASRDAKALIGSLLDARPQ